MGKIARVFEIAIDNTGYMQTRYQSYAVDADGVPVYRQGDYISGVVHISLKTTREDIEEICIRLQGRAKTGWTEAMRSRVTAMGDQEVTFKGTEEYMDHRVSLWPQANSSQRLSRGSYQFPYQFQVPLGDLPTSYEAAAGHVRYRLKCEISRGSSLSCEKVTKNIAIIARSLDLNTVQNALLPIHDECEALLSSLCCANREIKVQASADRRAYVPGETAYITAIVHSSSGTRYDVVIKLIEEATFRGTGSFFTSPGVSVARPGTCQRCRVIARKKTTGALQRRGETTLQREPLVIPDHRPLPDSGFQGCSIIDVSYFLSITPVPGRLRRARDTEVRLPITIGHTPCAPLPSYHASTSQMSHPSEPPPSYETATSVYHTTLPASDNVAFVNEAYTSALVQGRVPSSMAPLQQIIRIEGRDGEEQCGLSDNHGRLMSSPTPPLASPDVFSSDSEPDVGVENPLFLADVHEADHRTAAADEQLTSGSEPQTSSHVDPANLEQKAHTSSLDEIDGGSPVSKSQETEQPELNSTNVRTSHAVIRDRALSEDSITKPYFLPTYDTQLLGRIPSEDTYEGSQQSSISLTDEQISQGEIRNRGFSLDSITNAYFLPAYERELLGRIPSEDNCEENSEVSLHSFFGSISNVPKPHNTGEDSEATPAHASQRKDDQVDHHMVQYSVQPEESTPPIDPVTDSSFLDGKKIPSLKTHGSSSRAKEPRGINSKEPEKRNKLVASQNNNRTDAPVNFSERSSPGLRNSSERIERLGTPLDSPRKASSPATLKFSNSEKRQDTFRTISQESLQGLRVVEDHSARASRTPSPYFHPDDGRGDRDDARAISSCGSYSPTSEVARKGRRLPTSHKVDHAKLSNSAGTMKAGIKSKTTRSGGGLRESALENLIDSRQRTVEYSESFSDPKEVRRSAFSPKRGLKEKQDSAFRLREGPRTVRQTVSLPTMSMQNPTGSKVPESRPELRDQTSPGHSDANNDATKDSARHRSSRTFVADKGQQRRHFEKQKTKSVPKSRRLLEPFVRDYDHETVLASDAPIADYSHEDAEDGRGVKRSKQRLETVV